MWKTFILGLVVGSALLLISGVGASRPQRQTAEQKQRQAELERQKRVREKYQEELPDATPVEKGVLTEQQHRHSQLFSRYDSKRKPLSELAANAKNKIVERHIELPLIPHAEPETPESHFGRLAQESDVVIRGKVIRKVSQITEDDAFIFTDYTIVVEEIFNNKTSIPLNAQDMIIVTRAGGKVLLGETIVKVTDESFLPLPINKNIMMFLKVVPGANTYSAARYNACFELDGMILRPLTNREFPSGVLKDANSFLQTVKSVVSK